LSLGFFHCWLFQDVVSIEDYRALNDKVTDKVVWKWLWPNQGTITALKWTD